MIFIFSRNFMFRWNDIIHRMTAIPSIVFNFWKSIYSSDTTKWIFFCVDSTKCGSIVCVWEGCRSTSAYGCNLRWRIKHFLHNHLNPSLAFRLHRIHNLYLFGFRKINKTLCAMRIIFSITNSLISPQMSS